MRKLLSNVCYYSLQISVPSLAYFLVSGLKYLLNTICNVTTESDIKVINVINEDRVIQLA